MKRFLKWFDNYWYYYKWRTIIVTFCVAVAIMVTLQIVNRVHYDAYIMFVGEQAIPDTQYQDILDSFEKVTTDVNEDGEVLVNFSKTAYISDEDNELASTINAPTLEFMSSMIAQPYYIYLVSPELYELYKDTELFITLSDVLIDVPKEWFYDDTAIIFGMTDFSKDNAGVDKLGKESILLLLKNVPYSSSTSAMETERENYNHHLSILKTIINYRK